jgi:hypothetical protein
MTYWLVKQFAIVGGIPPQNWMLLALAAVMLGILIARLKE